MRLKGSEFQPKKKKKSLTAVMRSETAAEMIEKMVAEKMQHIVGDDADLDMEVNVNEMWKELKDLMFDALKGPTSKSEWTLNSRISEETMKLIKHRAQLQIRLEASGEISEELKIELKEIRKKVKQAARSDKIKFYEEIAEESEMASRVGNSRGVYAALRRAIGKRGGAADLRNADVNAFVHHFMNLVGVSEAKVSAECKEKEAWEIAEEWLGDRSRYEMEWEVDTGPPSWEEMQKAASMGKH